MDTGIKHRPSNSTYDCPSYEIEFCHVLQERKETRQQSSPKSSARCSEGFPSATSCSLSSLLMDNLNLCLILIYTPRLWKNELPSLKKRIGICGRLWVYHHRFVHHLVEVQLAKISRTSATRKSLNSSQFPRVGSHPLAPLHHILVPRNWD